MSGPLHDRRPAVRGSQEGSSIRRLAAATRVEHGPIEDDQRATSGLPVDDRDDPSFHRAQVRIAVGELEVHGIMSTSGKPADLAIVGGTGAYSNARGVATLIPKQQKLELKIEP